MTSRIEKKEEKKRGEGGKRIVDRAELRIKCNDVVCLTIVERNIYSVCVYTSMDVVNAVEDRTKYTYMCIYIHV